MAWRSWSEVIRLSLISISPNRDDHVTGTPGRVLTPPARLKVADRREGPTRHFSSVVLKAQYDSTCTSVQYVWTHAQHLFLNYTYGARYLPKQMEAVAQNGRNIPTRTRSGGRAGVSDILRPAGAPISRRFRTLRVPESNPENYCGTMS